MRPRTGEQRIVKAVPSGNVLVIEDDPDTGNFIVLTLAGAGYGVRLVTSRDEAILAMARYLYDYIVMDYNMPGLAPEAFLKQARTNRPRTQIILLTAGDRAADVAGRLKLPTWIGKPFCPEDLVAALQPATATR
jgi:DNA-binding response OmpR family regulator